MRFQRKVARVEQVDLQILDVLLKRLGAGLREDRIVLAPHGQHGRLSPAEVRVELRVQRKIALVVLEQVQLDVLVARSIHQQLVEVVCLRRDRREAIGVGDAGLVLPFRGLEHKKRIAELGSTLRRIVGPEIAKLAPEVPEPLHVCVAVLGDYRGDAVGAVQREPQANGSAVVENVNGEFRELQCVDEGADRCRDVLEGVFVLLLCGDFREPEARKIRGYHSVLAGKDRDEVSELVRRGREAVEKEDYWCCGRPSGAVEEIDPTCSDGVYFGICHDECFFSSFFLRWCEI